MTDRKSKKTDQLSEEDRQLWERIKRTAEPLKTNKAPLGGTPTANPPGGDPVPSKKRSEAGKQVARAAPRVNPPSISSTPPPPPDLSPLDRRTRQKLSRGSMAIDATIDLHGLTQRAAHRRLLGFLRSVQADGGRVVLVITGKGSRKDPMDGRFDSQPGILRRAVPEWLRTAEFRALVSGFDSAGRSHGGDGALYVRIRRKQRGGNR